MIEESDFGAAFVSGDWNDLKYFLAMVRHGRLTAAARQLGVNHSTVERRITALEKALSAKLFERPPSGFELTAKGQELVPFAEEIESRWLVAASEISGADVTLSGSVRIGAPDGLGMYFLARRLADLSVRYPELDLELVAMPQVLNPSKREADIAVGFTRPMQGHLTSRKLTDYTLSLYATTGYLEACGAPGDVTELRGSSMIGYIKDLIFVKELDYLSDIDAGLQPRLTSTNIVAQQIMALQGHGIAVLPDFMARQSPELQLVLPDVKLTRSYYISYSNSLANLLRIRTVIDAMMDWVREARQQLLR
ncbi:MAG: LysR family transcriptional regulator [Beijerinckiaceae bacterium]|uniref:LysR family transcriptional regulator n=1 Tax=Tabrizicola sp. TaxID=2005166 RepID=UPI003F32CCFD